MADSIEAIVLLQGRRVGILTYAKGGSTFSYEDDLTSADHQVLGQIFEDDPGKTRKARTGIPPWFANLLPEGELRRQVIRELGGVNVGDFTLLLRLGSSLPGAVTVHSSEEPLDDMLEELASPGDPDHPLRHSLAGVQLKYSVYSDRLTFPASGEKAWWIAKLPDRSLREICLNEFITMRWLRDARMNVPDIQLVRASTVGGIPEGLIEPSELVYLIKRFDRTPSGRVHVEDFAQIADVAPGFKYGFQGGITYDTLGRAVMSFSGADAYTEYVERLAAMLIVGNIDGHLKNWSVMYSDGRTPSLSPIYDFHSLTFYGTYRYSPLAFSLGDERMPGNIFFDNFRNLAEASEMDSEYTVEVVRATVSRLRDAWSGELRAYAESKFPDLAAHFVNRLDTLPICQE
jgi:serine/threonine-protein kinase HipA